MPKDPRLLSSVGLRRQEMGGVFSQVRMCASGISGICSEAQLRQLGFASPPPAPPALGHVRPESHFPWGSQDALPDDSHSCPPTPRGWKNFQVPFSGICSGFRPTQACSLTVCICIQGPHFSCGKTLNRLLPGPQRPFL